MSDLDDLEDLKRRLMTPGLPTQTALAKGAGVDQALVSRARNGQLKRVTDRVRELSNYVDQRIATMRIAASLPSPTRSTGRRRVKVPRETKLVLRRCREYLDDGHDPKVLLDQLEILRRIQSPAVGRPVRRT